MECTRWQEAVSARLDGEDPIVDPRLLDAHLAGCPECRAYEATADRAKRLARIQPAPTIPDLSRRIAKANALADRAASWSIVRAALGIVALQVIGFAMRPLLWGSEAVADSHEARHVGAFGVAYGVGLLVIVARPARARTMLPVAGVLAVTLTITAVIDMANGEVPAIAEASHIPEVISVVLVWMLASPLGRRRARNEASPRPTRTLRVVDDRSSSGDGPAAASGA